MGLVGVVAVVFEEMKLFIDAWYEKDESIWTQIKIWTINKACYFRIKGILVQNLVFLLE